MADTLDIKIRETITRTDEKGKEFIDYRIDLAMGLYEWSVYKRFSKFYKLYWKLKDTFTKTKLPDLPSRQILPTSKEDVENRKQKLEAFLVGIASNSNLVNSNDVQQFLEIRINTTTMTPDQKSPLKLTIHDPSEEDYTRLLQPVIFDRSLPRKPSAFCKKVTHIISIVDKPPLFHPEFWLEAQKDVVNLHQLCINAKKRCDDTVLELEIRRLLSKERPRWTKYNILSDKLKAVIKLVDNTTDPIEIHRNVEVILDYKDEELKRKDKLLINLQYEVGQLRDNVKQIEESEKFAERIKTLNKYETLQSKILEEGKKFDSKYKQMEEKYKDQLRQMNEKYMELSREYRAVLEDQQTQYEQKTIDFLNIHGQLESLTSRLKQTILEKNKRIERLESRLNKVQQQLTDHKAEEEMSITRYSTTIAQLHFRVSQLMETIRELQYKLADATGSDAAYIIPDPPEKASLNTYFEASTSLPRSLSTDHFRKPRKYNSIYVENKNL